jgi:hypothetical protein
MSYVDRQSEIVNAVNESVRLTANWIRELRKNDTLKPTEFIMLAWRNMILACSGDIPEASRSICVAVSVFQEEFRQYSQSYDGKVNPNGSPVGSFWAALAKVQERVMKSDTVYVEELESIKELRSQRVSDDQIAFHIYGNRGKEGPFITKHGTVNKRLLDLAAESRDAQDKILRDAGWPEQDGIFYPPWKAQSSTSKNKEDQERFEAFKALQEGPKAYEDPSSIEDMLYDGCYVQQIQRGKHCTREEVLNAAIALGIDVKDEPGFNPRLNQAITRKVEPVVPEHMKQHLAGEAAEGDIDPAGTLRPHVEVIANGNPTFGAAEIVEDLRVSGISATARQVSGILRSLKSAAKRQTVQ